MRRLWAQIAALGVGRIILTNAEKVERNYFDTHILAPETYRPLLIEGLQQARDTRLPVCLDPPAVQRSSIEDELDRSDLDRRFANRGGSVGRDAARAMSCEQASESRILLGDRP